MSFDPHEKFKEIVKDLRKKQQLTVREFMRLRMHYQACEECKEMVDKVAVQERMIGDDPAIYN